MALLASPSWMNSRVTQTVGLDENDSIPARLYIYINVFSAASAADQWQGFCHSLLRENHTMFFGWTIGIGAHSIAQAVQSLNVPRQLLVKFVAQQCNTGLGAGYWLASSAQSHPYTLENLPNSLLQNFCRQEWEYLLLWLYSMISFLSKHRNMQRWIINACNNQINTLRQEMRDANTGHLSKHSAWDYHVLMYYIMSARC